MTDLSKLAASLTDAQRRAVGVMRAQSEHDFSFVNSADLADRMGGEYTAEQARKVGRSLFKAGLFIANRGLVTEDGDFYGSGWALAEDGLALRAYLERNPDV